MARVEWVDRPRLSGLLGAAAGFPLRLVSAPAGFGKTVMLRGWAEGSHPDGDPVVVDVTDEDPVAVEAAVRAALGAFGGASSDLATGASGDAGTVGPADKGWPGLARAIARRGAPTTLVLDFGDLVVPPELGAALHRLLLACSGDLRLVLLTREDPPMPLHRYRLEGRLSEVRAADLAFTPEEAAELLRGERLELAPELVDQLHARTGGWPAGLRFAAMALAGSADPEGTVAGFRGDSGNVAAYLAHEVLETQPSEVREVLLRTCIVDDELPPGLVEALTERARGPRVMQFVARGNAFVQPVPGKEGVYRYHPLFREMLRAQLRFDRPGLVPALHRRASDWFARDGRAAEAVQHACAAQAWAAAAGYVVDGGAVGCLLTGEGGWASWLADLPAELPGPEAALVRAALALAALDTEGCVRALEGARSAAALVPLGRRRAFEVMLTVVEAVSASLGNDLDDALERVLAAEAALRLLDGGPPASRGALLAVLAGAQGRVLLRSGELRSAASCLVEGAHRAGPGPDATRASLLGMAALAEALRGRLRRTEEMTGSLRGPDEETAGVPAPRSALVALAWARSDEYDLGAVADLLRRAEGTPPTLDAALLEPALQIVRARLFRATGRPGLAETELRATVDRSGRPGQGWLSGFVLAEQARSVAPAPEGDGPGTRRETTRPDEAGPLPLRVEAWLDEAGTAAAHGDARRGRLHVERALRLAAPEHLRRPFLDPPARARRLLDPSELSALHPWLRPGLDEADTPRGRPVAGGPPERGPRDLRGPLTAKEREVLGHLAELLTTEEIAATMFVSVNTVRSHVRSVLRKLGAGRRNEAVRRAWELGILSGPDGVVEAPPAPASAVGTVASGSRR